MANYIIVNHITVNYVVTVVQLMLPESGNSSGSIVKYSIV